MLTERTTTLFVSIFYFQKCQTRDFITKKGEFERQLLRPGDHLPYEGRLSQWLST